MSNEMRYLLATLIGVVGFGGLLNHAAKTNFGAVNIKMEYPEGPTKAQRDALNAEMDQYRNPKALFNLLVKNERVKNEGGR